MAKIKVYGAPWCPDFRRVKKFLTEHRARYDWEDIDQDTQAHADVQRLQNGGQTIPTVVFGDGAMMVNPSNHTIAAKLTGRSTAVPASCWSSVAATPAWRRPCSFRSSPTGSTSSSTRRR